MGKFINNCFPTTGWSLPVPRLRRGHWRLTPNVGYESNTMRSVKIDILAFVVVAHLNMLSAFGMGIRPVESEVVMTTGMSIEASNESGTIRVTAGDGTFRTYSWDDGEKTAQLIKRPSRWYGSMGLYHPGGGQRVHLVVEEGQQHFFSEREVLEWLQWMNSRLHWVYTSDGLVVGWYKEDARKKGFNRVAIIVDVWQVYINGKKPVALPGASNEAVRVTSPSSLSWQGVRVGAYTPSEPKEIGGRIYSGRALDFMREQNVSVKEVEKVILTGKLFDVEPPEWRTFFFYGRNMTRMVVIDSSGRVVRVQD